MVRVDFIFFFCLLIFSTLAENYDCYPSTTPSPSSSFDCKRDIVIILDGTPYMKSKDNVKKEIQFIENMLSNWTFGDNGVNVAFEIFGFNGQTAFTQFYTTFKDCFSDLESYLSLLLIPNDLQPTLLNTVISHVSQFYGDGNASHTTYSHRPGIEPRLIAFSSTTNVTDILLSKQYFDQLYNNNYDTVLGIIYADVGLYSEIRTLKTIDMQAFDPDKTANISETIATALCYHDVRFTPSPCPSTVQSATPLATSPHPSATTRTSAVIPTGETGSPPTTEPTDGPLPTGTDRACKCNATNLWLDLVVIIDNSASMTQEGLRTVQAHISTLAGFMTLNRTLPQSVRISIISVSDKAKIVADFNDIKDMDILNIKVYEIQWDNVDVINIEESLRLAGNLIESQGRKRNNTKKVILLYTSAFTINGFNDPVPISKQLIESGYYIIGIQFIQSDESAVIESLSTITSPNMTFSNDVTYNPMKSELLDITLEALCWINCFCINLWNENKNPFTTFPNYAQCLYMSDIDGDWVSATMGCSSMTTGSAMSFAKTEEKYEYLLNLLANITRNINKLNLHLGITYNSTLKSYQYLDGSLMTSKDYTPWDIRNNFPNPAQGNCVAAYQSFGLNVFFRNVDCHTYFAHYACELAPCDTENYCSTLDII